MAEFRTLSLVTALTALSCFLLSPPLLSAAEKPELATEVCRNTTDFAFCRAAIFSDPRAPTADRYELIDIAFRKAYLNATDTRDYIASRLKSGGGNFGSLKKCLRNYERAIQTLSEMLNDLNSETYSGLDVLSRDVERSVRACRKGLREQPIVAKRNENMIKLANISYVVSKLFGYD